MKQKIKDPNRVGFRDYFGITAMHAADAIAAALMTSWFMIYLTDYSGIGQYAALLGTTLLLCTRLFDAVNDPIQGWVMDRAKVTKYGKYKPFIIISIILYVVGVSALFFIPSGLKNPVALCAYVIIAYLLFDMGQSFFAPNLIIKSVTRDENARGKLITGPRMVGMIGGMVVSAIISIVNVVNAQINNMHDSFGIAVIIMMVAVGAISLLGICLVKERHHTKNDDDDNVKITDIFRLIKDNKALQTVLLSTLFGGFIWNFLFATMLYYIKWAYCADLTTGAVNTDLYGTYSLIGSMMMFLPLIVGTLVANPLMKKFKSAMHFYRFNLLLETIPGAILFVLQILGLLQLSPFVFFGCLAVSATAIGMNYIPQSVIYMECMDYEIYRSGKDRSAQCNACNKFIEKAQAAVSAGVVGIVLTAIGYQVDSATDTYLGELSAIPALNNWFIVIMGLIPFVLGLIAWVVLRKYPITSEIRADMKAKLSK